MDRGGECVQLRWQGVCSSANAYNWTFQEHLTSSTDSCEANREGDDSGGPSARMILLAGCVTCFVGNLHFPVC